jgi:DNA helicase-2/ATP-dependent DNA helicase PcrA
MTDLQVPSPSLPAVPVADPLATGERLRLSFSRVDTYRTCPLKFRFGYVDKLPQEPSPHLSWGSSIHAALETWWDQKLPAAPPVEVLLQGLYDGWDDSGFEGMERDEKLRWYAHAQDVLRRHHDRHSISYVPAVATEEWFTLELDDDIEVVGSIDHVARTAAAGIGIVDWKTNRKAKPARYVTGSLQLAIYALAARELWGVDPEWVALDFVVPGVRVTVPREDIDTDAALATIREVADLIRAETFTATPNRLCDWCDYRAVCPAFEGDGGPDVAGLAVVELGSLRRRRARDEARMLELEKVIRERLGEEALVEIE